MIDGKTISILEDKDERSTMKTIHIQLPMESAGKTKIELKIKAGAGFTSHKILEIRTLRPD